jgi:hypothetical protein
MMSAKASALVGLIAYLARKLNVFAAGESSDTVRNAPLDTLAARHDAVRNDRSGMSWPAMRRGSMADSA